MKNLFLIIFSFLSLSAYSQLGEFEVLAPFTLSGVSDQVKADSIQFEKGEIVAFKESFGVLIIEKDNVVVRTSYKSLNKLEGESKIKMLPKSEKKADAMPKQEELLKKINAKLNFLVGATIVGATAGIISVISLLRAD